MQTYRLLVALSSAIMVIGLAVCLSLWPDGYISGLDKVAQFRAEVQKGQALYCLAGGVVFGLLILGFGFVVQKLEEIRLELAGETANDVETPGGVE